MVDGAPPSTDGGREPVRELVEEGEALVGRIAAGSDRDDPDVTPGDAGRPYASTRPPGEARQRPVGVGADDLDQRFRPGRRAQSPDRRARKSSPASTIHASRSGSR